MIDLRRFHTPTIRAPLRSLAFEVWTLACESGRRSEARTICANDSGRPYHLRPNPGIWPGTRNEYSVAKQFYINPPFLVIVRFANIGKRRSRLGDDGGLCAAECVLQTGCGHSAIVSPRQHPTHSGHLRRALVARMVLSQFPFATDCLGLDWKRLRVREGTQCQPKFASGVRQSAHRAASTSRPTFLPGRNSGAALNKRFATQQGAPVSWSWTCKIG
jgi:hypothetical protein